MPANLAALCDAGQQHLYLLIVYAAGRRRTWNVRLSRSEIGRFTNGSRQDFVGGPFVLALSLSSKLPALDMASSHISVLTSEV